MSIFDRYGLNFDTARFGAAHTLSPGASNTISLIANTTPQVAQWQVDAIQSSSPVRSNYFKNPTSNNVSSMLVSTANIAINCLAVANSNSEFTNVFSYANNLIIALNSFQSHTDNISGLNVTSDPSVPSYDTAFGIGQISIMNLTKFQEPQANTDVMLGCFTSLFIPDILKANDAQLIVYNTQLANSIQGGVDEGGNTYFYSTLTSQQITNLENYLISTSSVLNTRRLQDWNFYQNSIQILKDVAFIQQFSSMGGTQFYLANNIIGTPSLVANLTSSTT